MLRTDYCARLFAAALAIAPFSLHAQFGRPGEPLFLTATNGATNYLAVLDTRMGTLSYVPTGGNGGASGNAGGVAVANGLAAVVNFGSSNVTIFVRQGNSVHSVQMIPTASKPVSVAFGGGHLLVLGQTSLESFPISGSMVSSSHDGMTALIANDGTAGQVVAYDGGAVFSETSGDIGVVHFGIPGIAGPAVPVVLPPAPNNNTPLGMIGRGANVYASIAHSDLETLIVNGKIVSMAVGPTPFMNSAGSLTHAPCWNALSGQFMFASDSPGSQLLRYLVSDSNIFFDKASVAQLSGSPTDLAVDGTLLGVIDGGNGTVSDVSLFDIDSEGELTLHMTLQIPSAINGAAFM